MINRPLYVDKMMAYTDTHLIVSIIFRKFISSRRRTIVN